MAGKEKTEEVIESQETKTEEQPEEQFVTPSSLNIGDEIAKSKTENTEETKETLEELVEEVLEEAEEVKSEATETTEETKETEETEETPEPDKVQQRIDELISRSKTAEEEKQGLKEQLIRLEEQVKHLEVKPKTEASTEISDEQLNKALGKFIEEGDTQGIMDVIDYKVDKKATEERAKYDKELATRAETQKKNQKTWESIIEDFSPESYKIESVKSNQEFDITDVNSSLYKLSSKLWDSGKHPNPDGSPGKYAGDFGMKRAVQDAYALLLEDLISGKKIGKKKSKSKETEGLENRLLKEQKKRSPSSGGSGAEEKPKKPKTSKSNLEDVLAERQNFKNKRTNMV